MFGIFDHHVEGVERLLARESSYLSPRNVRFGACNRGADGGQESRLIYAGDFFFHCARRLPTFFFPAHLDLPVRVAFENRRATHSMNCNASPSSDETDYFLSRQRGTTHSESH